MNVHFVFRWSASAATRLFFLSLILPLLQFSCHQPHPGAHEPLPNIVIIYFDDLGYGDVSAYGAEALRTTHIDRLAEGGVRFTRGYASSATCTPSRYALLTGEYPWRNQSARILPGSAPLIIDTAKATLATLLRQQGYHTGVVGKWHLGLGSGDVDWNQQVSPGPNELGFDYSFIMASTQDRTPTVYLENGYVQGLLPDDPLFVSYEQNFEGEPTGLEHPELCRMMWHHGHNQSIHNGIPRIGYQKGGKSAMWVDEDMADDFLARAETYIRERKHQPFFLYYALHQPHVPRTPHARFAGSSGMGPRGDAILEADWCVGKLLSTLEEHGLLDNTLIVLTSDNGPVVNDGYYDDAVESLGDHRPWGPLRGGKYSLFEAGTRIPFITYWKGQISPAVSDAMVSQIDIFSSLAELSGSDQRAPDSQPLLDVLLGKSDQGRHELIIEATSRTALRQHDWVMIPPYPGPAVQEQVDIELGNDTRYQLYRLNNDLGQEENVAAQNPQKLNEMIDLFNQIRGTNLDFQPLILQ